MRIAPRARQRDYRKGYACGGEVSAWGGTSGEHIGAVGGITPAERSGAFGAPASTTPKPPTTNITPAATPTGISAGSGGNDYNVTGQPGGGWA